MSDALVRRLVVFGRVLREAGLEAGPGRLTNALIGLDAVGLADREDVYWTLRTTLVARHEELEPFDRAFEAWFLRAPDLERAFEEPAAPAGPGLPDPGLTVEGRRLVGVGEQAEEDAEEPPLAGWSARETLRRKDFAAMTPDEYAAACDLVASVAARRPTRRSHRLERHSRGRVLDMRGILRHALATGGDPIERRYRRRTDVPRKLVALCDVSGSMEAYVRPLLLFLHALVASGRGIEAFAFGTRLTRLTPDLRSRSPEAALAASAERLADWGGGTLIGASLRTYNQVWGRRSLTRGAVVVIVSDGWERQDAGLVSAEMARLARSAYEVVWVNPLKGRPEYQPLAAGMRAALRYVDRFVSGRDLASLEELAQILGGIDRRHAA